VKRAENTEQMELQATLSFALGALGAMVYRSDGIVALFGACVDSPPGGCPGVGGWAHTRCWVRRGTQLVLWDNTQLPHRSSPLSPCVTLTQLPHRSSPLSPCVTLTQLPHRSSPLSPCVTHSRSCRTAAPPLPLSLYLTRASFGAGTGRQRRHTILHAEREKHRRGPWGEWAAENLAFLLARASHTGVTLPLVAAALHTVGTPPVHFKDPVEILVEFQGPR
jgi:hypothetical protein